MYRRTYDTDEITLRKVFARTSTNMVVPAMTVLTADGAGGTYWAIPSTLGYNPSFNQIVTDAATFTANLSYNTLTLSEGGGIGFVEGEGTNQLYIYSKGFNQLNVAGGNSLYGFSNNVTRPALNFAGAGGISLQTNPTTNTVTFTANGQPISTTLNSFQSLKVFPNLSTPTGQVSSLSGYSVLSANNYSSILTLAGTGQISLTSDYNANAVFIGLNTSTLVTSNLTTQIVSTASIYASTLTLIDLVGGNPKNLYSYNGSLFLNGVAISGGAGTVAQIYGGSNIVLTGPTPGLGNVTVNVDTGFLTSTVIGLGTAGYISTASGGVAVLPGGLVSTANLTNLISTSFFDTQLISTVIGLGSADYISSSQLLSTSFGLAALIQNPPGGVTPENLTSTVIGLGTVGYISSSQLLSTSAGLAALIQNPPGGVTPDNLTSTVIGLGTAGYLSTANGTAVLPEGLVSTANLANLISTGFFDTQLTSTVIGLGTAGYVSTATLISFSTAQSQNFYSSNISVSSLTTSSLTFGTGSGYLFLPNTVMNSLSVGILIASTIINENIYILAGSKLILTSTVGINCNTPAYTLDVNGNINANTGYFLNGAVFTSDRRIKTNITSADTLLCYSTVRELPLHRFEYMSSFRQSKHDIKQIGFIADEVETVFPKSIYTAPVNKDGLSTLKFVNFEQIQMAHFGATQYMASLLEQQNSTIVGQNVSIASLQTDVLNLSTTLGVFMTR